MTPASLGDRAALFNGLRHSVALRTRLAERSQELATGQVGDAAAHLRGDTRPLADLDRRLSAARIYREAAGEAGRRLDLMQDALDRVEGTRGALAADLMDPEVLSRRATAAGAARGRFADTVSALNASLAGGALFAGTATDGAALAPAEAILADLRAAVAGATSAADVAARLDVWFDDPAGGFATSGYLGSGVTATRPLDADSTVTLGPRADDPALRGVLKAMALGALADDPGLAMPDVGRDDLLRRSRDALLSLSEPLTRVRAGLGLEQARAEQAVARHGAQATAWGLLRNGMTQADPFSAASELEALRTQLETHYEVTSRLSALHLTRFLR